MKIKSLLLGSVAAAGLSTGAFAADLNVLTSLDVCDSLGITGLTISSDTNCLAISGHVDYKASWGDFNQAPYGAAVFLAGAYSPRTGNGGTTGNDWYSSVDAWLKFVGTADSDFGPASATLKFDYDNDSSVTNELGGTPGSAVGNDIYSNSGANATLRIEEAFVSVGDSTVLMAGQKGSISNMGDDVDLGWMKLYNSERVNGPDPDVSGGGHTSAGVETAFLDQADAGPSHVIQIVTDLGNGFSAGLGIENINGINTNAAVYGGASTADDGTLVGTIAYAGDTVTAHGTIVAGGFMDGVIEVVGFHGGVTASIDMFNFVAALALDSNGEWNALGSASATFDIFTIAASVEGTSGPTNLPGNGDQWGFAASASAAVTDSVTINLGGRWMDQDVTLANTELLQIAASLVFAATESITLTGEIGFHSTTMPQPDIFYGSAEVAWAPGGGFTTSLKGEVNNQGGYAVTYNAAKSFQ